jgi:hypothetical protein
VLRVYSPKCVEDEFCELRQEFIANSSGLARVSVGWVLTFSEQFLLRSRAALVGYPVTHPLR